MPFKKKTPISKDPVKNETNQSVPTPDEIGVVPKAPELPVQTESTHKEIPTVDFDEVVDFSGIHGWNMTEMEFMDIGLRSAPKPPLCVQEYCKARDLVWRWLSYPMVKHKGMRGHVALSLTPELRKKIKAGDCPPTIDIDVSNKLTWREDAFLGVMPRKLADMKKRSVRLRTEAQNQLARQAGQGLKELARRAGAKIVEYDVEETSRPAL